MAQVVCTMSVQTKGRAHPLTLLLLLLLGAHLLVLSLQLSVLCLAVLHIADVIMRGTAITDGVHVLLGNESRCE